MDLHSQYQYALHRMHFDADPAQVAALAQLQSLGERLCLPVDRGTWFSNLFGSKPHGPRGIYLWGGVGRGKTWLMDLFFDALPFEHKLRLHFRHFMQEIHDELAQLAGHRDPLSQVAKHFAQRARVLCLDEFFVEDITDAMILHRLLSALIEERTTLVFTSNLAPAELYRHGLQRQRFLPAIALIEACTEVIELNGDTDHRLRKLKQAHRYFSSLNTASNRALQQRFAELAPSKPQDDVLLTINHRQIPCLRCADDVALFDFLQLCHGPRASADYIELARRFHTLFIANVPVMGEHEEEWAHRFMDLVDECYDRRVKLVISADNEPIHLYHGRRHAFDFQRTVSRLMEMRSHAYLAQAHRP